MMKPFAKLSYLAQVRRMRSYALETLQAFPFQVTSLKFIHHGENTTFKVTDRRKKHYLLRIHRNGYHTLAAINEELSWLEYLSHKTDLKVPQPLRSKSHRLVGTLHSSLILETRNYCLFHWMDGRFIENSISKKQVYQLGLLVGKLQRSSLNRKTTRRKYWTAKGLVGPAPKFSSTDNLTGVSQKQQKQLREYRLLIFKKLRAFEIRFPKRQGLIHADLHFGNLLWQKNKFAAIDFDDSGFGFFTYDVAIPLMRVKDLLKRQKKSALYPEFKKEFIRAYSTQMPWDLEDDKILDWMAQARMLVMLGWLESRSDNPRLRKYKKVALKKIMKVIEQEPKKSSALI